MTKDPKEPILREEYERRHTGLRQRYESFAKRTYIVLTVMVIGLLITGGVSAYLFKQNDLRTKDNEKLAKENAMFSAALSKSLVENCEFSGNPLRAAVRKFGNTLIGQVEAGEQQTAAFKKSGLLTKLFPNFTPEELNQLIEAGERNNDRTIEGLEDAVDEVIAVDCQTKYPTKDPSTSSSE